MRSPATQTASGRSSAGASSLAAVAAARLCWRIASVASDEPPELDADLGGETTRHTATRTSFSFPAPNLSRDERRTFEVGDSLFNQNWVTAPASTDARDGLGPMFNAQACSSCHVLDGRGVPPTPDGRHRADRIAAAPVGARRHSDGRPGRTPRVRRSAAGPLDPRCTRGGNDRGHLRRRSTAPTPTARRTHSSRRRTASPTRSSASSATTR